MSENNPQPQPEPSQHRLPGASRRSSRGSLHRHSSRSQRKIFRLRLIAAALSIVVATLGVGWLLTNSRLSEISDKYYREQAHLRKDGNSSEALSARIAELEKQNATLVLGQIPGLQLLEYDKTLHVEQNYLRNIGFTLTGTVYSRNYEYRAVLHNGGLNIVQPSVTIYLFDERGIQIGETRLSKDDATSRVDSEVLQPDETRSYSGRVALNLEAEPKYFLITMD